ncbi:DegT/DnrJ/EryC1/StrS family aminotransferase [candidate division KSB1 bacterium]|nr:DegT/DnrJ/EryC1/StrS family aminotransferase [candidate division KSB1 bacterium]
MMHFIDLAAQQKRIRDKIESHIATVLDHGDYIMGPEVKLLEERLAQYVGTKHAVGCSSGTDALLMALMAHQVGPGDAILTSPFTFIATAEVISLLGATPVFVDIDRVTFNLDPAELELAIQAVQKNDAAIYPIPKTNAALNTQGSTLVPKGIIVVDLFGLVADYEKIGSIAEAHKLFVIEDAAQSFGAEFNGRKSCAFGSIACTSFYPAKPLGCYGDGGMCFTDDDKLDDAMESIRVHGKGQDKYDNIRIGINGRLDTLQAAILLSKFDIFPEEIELRQEVANRYTTMLNLRSNTQLPAVPEGYKSAWAQYSILAENEAQRSNLQSKLKAAGIPTAIYYPKPLHLQSAFAALGYRKGDFLISEETAGRIFSVPMHPYLTKREQEKIAEVFRSVI